LRTLWLVIKMPLQFVGGCWSNWRRVVNGHIGTCINNIRCVLRGSPPVLCVLTADLVSVHLWPVCSTTRREFVRQSDMPSRVHHHDRCTARNGGSHSELRSPHHWIYGAFPPSPVSRHRPAPHLLDAFAEQEVANTLRARSRFRNYSAAIIAALLESASTVGL